MRIFMRILLTIYILFVLFISVMILGCTWGFIDEINPQYWVSLIYGDVTVRFVVSVIGVAVVLLSIALMFSGIKRHKPEPALIKNTGMGAISISVNAIEEMVVRHAASHEAVRNVKASISIKDSKINISAKLTVAEGSNLPEVLQSLQTSLKEHIHILTGVEVDKILLLVEKTSQIVKARVE